MKQFSLHAMAGQVLGALVITTLTVFSQSDTTSPDLDAKIAQLTQKETRVEDVIRLLGEPQRYSSGPYDYGKTNLPDRYILWYPKNFSFLAGNGKVLEVRAEAPGPGFAYRNLHLGSSLEEVLQVVGQPIQTVTGKMGSAQGVLYKDIEGIAGRCSYKRKDQNVDFEFVDYKVRYLRITVNAGEPIRPDNRLKEVVEYQDVRGRDLSLIDFSTRPHLPATFTFDQKTIWPTGMPAGINPALLFSNALNPGLGIRQLHATGLTGQSVSLAIIDGPLSLDHPDLNGKIFAYHDVASQRPGFSGPVTASLLVGNVCGTAPGTRLFYAAVPGYPIKDASYEAKALEWVIEQNATLPMQGKIRLVVISHSPSRSAYPIKNLPLWEDACARAESAGIWLLDGAASQIPLGPCSYEPADPDNVSKCQPGTCYSPAFEPGTLLVPCWPRTVSEPFAKGQSTFFYCGRGSQPWTLPYCAGVLALGWQARPELSPAEMRDLLFKSAYQAQSGALIINPPEFIRLVRH